MIGLLGTDIKPLDLSPSSFFHWSIRRGGLQELTQLFKREGYHSVSLHGGVIYLIAQIMHIIHNSYIIFEEKIKDFSRTIIFSRTSFPRNLT